MKKCIVFLLVIGMAGLLVFSQSIRVIEPGRNAEYIIGEMFPIKWQKSGLKNPVRIVLKRNGITLGEIARLKDPDITDFAWRVGKHSRGMAPAGGKYRIMVQEIGYQGNGVASMSPGTFFLRPGMARGTEIVLDPAAVVPEQFRAHGTEIVLNPADVMNENNVTLVEFRVTKGGGSIIHFSHSKPDFRVTVYFRVKNTGKNRTPAIYCDLNYWPAVYKHNMKSVSEMIPPLAPGQEWSKALTGNIKKNSMIQVVVDSTNALKESNENDNRSKEFWTYHL